MALTCKKSFPHVDQSVLKVNGFVNLETAMSEKGKLSNSHFSTEMQKKFTAFLIKVTVRKNALSMITYC